MADRVWVPKELVLFLLGEGEWRGRDFGDEPPTKAGRRQPYWWRSDLRAALSAAPSGEGEAVAWATCQACGGRIEGWICQGCGLPFRERDDGALIVDLAAMEPRP